MSNDELIDAGSREQRLILQVIQLQKELSDALYRIKELEQPDTGETPT